MEKLLTLTGDDFWRSCSRLIGLLKSRNRFIFNDLRGGGLGEPTETSELAGLGVLCGISRCIFLWPLSTSWLYPYGLAPNSFLRAIKNASAKRAAVTRKTSAQRATQTPTTKMARGQNAMLMLLGSLSLFLGQALSTGFGASKLVGTHDVTDSRNCAACLIGNAASLSPRGRASRKERDGERES